VCIAPSVFRQRVIEHLKCFGFFASHVINAGDVVVGTGSRGGIQNRLFKISDGKIVLLPIAIKRTAFIIAIRKLWVDGNSLIELRQGGFRVGLGVLLILVERVLGSLDVLRARRLDWPPPSWTNTVLCCTGGCWTCRRAGLSRYLYTLEPC